MPGGSHMEGLLEEAWETNKLEDTTYRSFSEVANFVSSSEEKSFQSVTSTSITLAK